MTVAYVHHPACEAHDTGEGHPEAPERVAAIHAAVRGDPALAGELEEIRAEAATVEDLLLVHAPAHVTAIREAAERAAREETIRWADPETAVSGASFEAALAAAGCAIAAAEAVWSGRFRGAFAAARPPGHHASRDRASGFCLFDNVAIAARRLQRAGADRVLVVDVDVHHGDGTQEIFWEDPSVFVLSTHLYPHFPGTGAEEERGAGAGLGTTRNVPLPHGTGAAEHRRRFSAALGATLAVFAPDAVLVSAGFDCLAGDPLGGLLLEPDDLHAILREIVERTRPSARGRVAAVLEGGYVPPRVGAGAVAMLRALAGA